MKVRYARVLGSSRFVIEELSYVSSFVEVTSTTRSTPEQDDSDDDDDGWSSRLSTNWRYSACLPTYLVRYGSICAWRTIFILPFLVATWFKSVRD